MRFRTRDRSPSLSAYMAAADAYWASTHCHPPPTTAPAAPRRNTGLPYTHGSGELPDLRSAAEPPATTAATGTGLGFGGIGWDGGAGGTPLLERDSSLAGAPPAVTPGGVAQTSRPATPRSTPHQPRDADGNRVDANGQRVTTGSVVNGGFALTGRDSGKRRRSSGPLSASEARVIAAHVARQDSAGAVVVAEATGRRPLPSIPKRHDTRTRSVLRMTQRVIGRPAGITAVVAGLRAIGFAAAASPAGARRRKAG